MALIDEISTPIDWRDYPYGFVERYGFMFKSGASSSIWDVLQIREPMCKVCFPGVTLEGKTEQEYIDFINENHLTKVSFLSKTVNIARYCPSLQFISVSPPFDFDENLDLSPLYALENVRSLSLSISFKQELRRKKYLPLANKTIIDYTKIRGLEALGVVLQPYGHVGYEKIPNLKTLFLTNYEGVDLWQAFCSPVMDSLSLSDAKIKTLDGIEQSKKMQCLTLLYCRSLHDLSALKKVKSTLKSLSLLHCPKAKDLSVLSELENLEYLQIEGTFTIPDVEFLKDMKNLKTLILTCPVESGDMSPCLGIQTVYFDNKRHYNLKNEDMQHTEPKVLGNEDIEAWRRIGM